MKEAAEERPVPLVSVCVPTYQHVPFIRQCLDSILAQKTSFPFEIILGEDGSNDGTREICIEYAENYPDIIRLFLRRREDVIYIGGRPTGRFNFVENIRAARGKYVAICDGDDYWIHTDKLQKQFDFLEANPESILAFHDAITIDEQGQQVAEGRVHENVKRDFTGRELQEKKWILVLSMFFRNGKINFPEEFYKVVNADTFLISLLGAHGGGKFFSDIMGAYRVNRGSIWNARSQFYKILSRVRTFGWISKYYRRIGDVELARYFLKVFQSMMEKALEKLPESESDENLEAMRGVFLEHEELLPTRLQNFARGGALPKLFLRWLLVIRNGKSFLKEIFRGKG